MEVRVPGDKSISQRALILASLSDGASRLVGLLEEGDPASTAKALRRLGVSIPNLGPEVVVEGMGLRGLKAPSDPLDLENSGTGARLLLGVLAGQMLEAVVTGDQSLRRRPMGRVTDPLERMGARFEFLGAQGCLPVREKGGALVPLSYRLPVASAQLKSALLLAGLVGGVRVGLVEPGRSRDHTERLLQRLGVSVTSGPHPMGWSVVMSDPPSAIPAMDLHIPGDFSSAAFFLVLGLLGGAGDELILRGVGLSETRTGLLAVLERMGARVRVETSGSVGEAAGETAGDLVAAPSELLGCEVGGAEIPGLIDEIPVLAAAAARASGITRITGAEELRVKETDRIRVMVENLRAVGVQVEELSDGMEIVGSDRPMEGRVRSLGDHRIAMAFGVLGALPGNDIRIDGPEAAGVSFPGFWRLLEDVSRDSQGGGRAP